MCIAPALALAFQFSFLPMTSYHSEKGSLIHITNQPETQKREFNLKQRVTYLRHSKINNIKTL